jgi:pyruvate dehydrogenase E2 component (dihydrolipoamide acetyltransferase)
VPVAPKARALAKELGVEVSQLAGTGYAGLITTQDVRRAAEGINEPRPKEVEPPHPPLPFRRRQAIAQKMQKSKQTVPHFYLMVDVNMSQAQRLRSYCTETLGWERPPTYTGMFIRACALALASMPEVNAIYHDQGLVPRDTIDIGVVVGLEDGLLVPVVSQADHLTLEETSRNLSEIVDRARSGKLRDAQLGQKSMVVSNLGMYGMDAFIAVIDIPDPMILAVGRILDRVVPFNGQPAIAPFCTLTLSADHRALDGVSGSKFLGKVASAIENPYELLR